MWIFLIPFVIDFFIPLWSENNVSLILLLLNLLRPFVLYPNTWYVLDICSVVTWEDYIICCWWLECYDLCDSFRSSFSFVIFYLFYGLSRVWCWSFHLFFNQICQILLYIFLGHAVTCIYVYNYMISCLTHLSWNNIFVWSSIFLCLKTSFVWYKHNHSISPFCFY